MGISQEKRFPVERVQWCIVFLFNEEYLVMVSTRSRITALPVIVAGAFAASLPLSLKALAQDASPEAGAPENPFADLGLPELTVNVTATAFEGIPESVEAGSSVIKLMSS